MKNTRDTAGVNQALLLRLLSPKQWKPPLMATLICENASECVQFSSFYLEKWFRWFRLGFGISRLFHYFIFCVCVSPRPIFCASNTGKLVNFH